MLKRFTCPRPETSVDEMKIDESWREKLPLSRATRNKNNHAPCTLRRGDATQGSCLAPTKSRIGRIGRIGAD